jgi:hypothetical protein
MSLGFYSKSEAYTVSLCPDSLCPDGIGRTWDRTDMGSDGHGIPSRIAVTFYMIPPGNEQTWDRTDMGSLLGSNGPSVSTYFLRVDSVVWLSHTSSV